MVVASVVWLVSMNVNNWGMIHVGGSKRIEK